MTLAITRDRIGISLPRELSLLKTAGNRTWIGMSPIYKPGFILDFVY